MFKFSFHGITNNYFKATHVLTAVAPVENQTQSEQQQRRREGKGLPGNAKIARESGLR